MPDLNLKTKPMRILVTGFLLLALWTALSVYLYVNKIKDFNSKPTEMQVETIPSIPLPPKVLLPEKLVIYFDSDKSDFNPDNPTETHMLGFKAWIDQNPGSKITITGHTDATGSKSYNMNLGDKRASVVRNYFLGKGITTDKLNSISKGEGEPVAENNSAQGKAKNRRTEITIN
jgi:outer membrane protein OmpA-like peptidoglycan-associated protein